MVVRLFVLHFNAIFKSLRVLLAAVCIGLRSWSNRMHFVYSYSVSNSHNSSISYKYMLHGHGIPVIDSQRLSVYFLHSIYCQLYTQWITKFTFKCRFHIYIYIYMCMHICMCVCVFAYTARISGHHCASYSKRVKVNKVQWWLYQVGHFCISWHDQSVR